jgi:nitrous oxide reductase accessory protein NosL
MPRIFSLMLLFMLVVGCSQQAETGPVEVRWDKDICERCAMAVSDRHYSAQVRGGPADKKTRVYKFDDIGCAVIWLDKKAWKTDPRTEIWVNDYRNGKWIDARQASFVTDKVTPMGYGLGAQTEKVEGALNFAAAREHIYQVESSEHKHKGGHMHPMSSGN